MLNLYYRIWVDVIVSTRAKRAEEDSWKLFTIVPMSLLMGVNLLTLFLWMRTLFSKKLLLYFPVHIFNIKPLDAFVSVIISFFLPFVILNYLLIFTNDRYEGLITRYQPREGKLYRRYALISLGLLIIPVIIVTLFFHEV